jgi:hypothetical protein
VQRVARAELVDLVVHLQAHHIPRHSHNDTALDWLISWSTCILPGSSCRISRHSYQDDTALDCDAETKRASERRANSQRARASSV